MKNQFGLHTRGGGGQKRSKFCVRTLWTLPYAKQLYRGTVTLNLEIAQVKAKKRLPSSRGGSGGRYLPPLTQMYK